MGLQAKAIESQTKVNLATVAEKVANATKTREEAENEKEERPNIRAEGERIKAATDLLLKQGITENEKAKLTKQKRPKKKRFHVKRIRRKQMTSRLNQRPRS